SSDPKVAWAEFERINDRELIVAAAAEYYPAAIDFLGHEALSLVESSNESGETKRWSAKAVLRTAESAFCIGAFDHVRTLVESRLEEHSDSTDAVVRYDLARVLNGVPLREDMAPFPPRAG